MVGDTFHTDGILCRHVGTEKADIQRRVLPHTQIRIPIERAPHVGLYLRRFFTLGITGEIVFDRCLVSRQAHHLIIKDVFSGAVYTVTCGYIDYTFGRWIQHPSLGTQIQVNTVNVVKFQIAERKIRDMQAIDIELHFRSCTYRIRCLTKLMTLQLVDARH